MADPTKPDIDYSYTGFQQEQQDFPFPGTNLDHDLAELKRAADDTIDALKDIRRDDGKLNNELVTPDSLSPATRALMVGQGATGPTGPTGPQGIQGPPGADGTGTGTVTSVDLSLPTGLQVSGSPITTSGTFAVTYQSGYQGYTTTEASKLSGIASGATANSSDAALLARANHTGTQLAATISDFSTAADARISAAIGSTVQAYDADLATIAGLTATTNNFIVSVSSAWASRTPAQVRTTLGLVVGTDVQAYDADLASWAGVTRASGFDTFATTSSSANLRALLTDETGTGAAVFATSPTITSPTIDGTITEDVYTITDGAGFAIDPTNGSIQFITLGANRTPVASNFNNGQSVTLMINDGTAYTITWTTVAVTWVGGVAPVLATSGYTVVDLWKAGGVIYGARIGEVA